MSLFTRYLVGFTFLFATLVYLAGCTARNTNTEYACITPIGDVLVSPKTDTGIRLKDGVLKASRGGDTITIPFSQCVGMSRQK